MSIGLTRDEYDAEQAEWQAKVDRLQAALVAAIDTLRDLAHARQLGWTKALDCEHVAQMALDAIEVSSDE